MKVNVETQEVAHRGQLVPIMERDEKVEVKVETQVEIIPVVEEMEMGCVPTMLMSQLTCVLTM